MSYKCVACGSEETWVCTRIFSDRQFQSLNCHTCGEVSDVPEKKLCGGPIAVNIPIKLSK
jgi:transcription elongation factor Elf1